MRFIDSLFGMPMTAVPRLIVQPLGNPVEPSLYTVVHSRLIHCGKKCFPGHMAFRSSVGQGDVNLPTQLLQFAFHSCLDLIRLLFIREPVPIALETVPLIHGISTTNHDFLLSVQIVYRPILCEQQIWKRVLHIHKPPCHWTS